MVFQRLMIVVATSTPTACLPKSGLQSGRSRSIEAFGEERSREHLPGEEEKSWMMQ